MIARWVVLALLIVCVAPGGCGTESTVSGPDDGEPGQAVHYVDLSVGFDTHYRLYDHAGDSIGTTRLKIIDRFYAADFSGFVAVDSIPRWLDTLNYLDTFWLVSSGDTIFQLDDGYSYQQRQPVVRNHTETDLSWSLYAVGSPGTTGRYNVVFHQRPETETVVLPVGGIYTNCGRTDLLAIYELSADTVILGTEYFAPNVGRILSSFRPFVQSQIYYRELIR